MTQSHRINVELRKTNIKKLWFFCFSKFQKVVFYHQKQFF